MSYRNRNYGARFVGLDVVLLHTHSLRCGPEECRQLRWLDHVMKPLNLCDTGINARSSTKSVKAHCEMASSYCDESGGLCSAKLLRSAWIRGSKARAAAAS